MKHLVLLFLFSFPFLTQAKAPSSKLIAAVSDVKANPQSFRLHKKKISSLKEKEVLKFVFAKQTLSKDSNESCKKFYELFRSRHFNFKSLAYSKLLRHCPEQIKKVTFSPKPYFSKSILETKIKNCENKSTSICAELFIQKSKQNLPQSLKVDFIQKAIRIAKKNKKNTATRIYKKRLNKISPKFNLNPTPKQYLSLANDFQKSRDFKNANFYYNKIINGRFLSGTKIKALAGIAKSHKLQRDFPPYVKSLKNQYLFAKKLFGKIPHKKLNKIGVNYARAVWTYSSRVEAEKILNEIINFKQKNTSKSEAYWVLGRIEEEKLDYNKSIIYFDKALGQRPYTLDFQEKVLWFKAWNLRKLKRYAESIKTLSSLISKTKNPYSLEKYVFWKAYMLNLTGAPNDSRKLFKEIIDRSPMNFYSFLAFRQLKTKIEFRSKNISFKKIKRGWTLDTANWYRLMGEEKAAKAFLLNTISKYKKKLILSDYNKIYKYYSENNMYIDFFKLTRDLGLSDKNLLFYQNSKYFFPQPFSKVISKADKKFKFDKNIIYSIIRQESAFDKFARSHADAFGLMQLIPEVAEKNQTRLDLGYKEPDDLFNPEINVGIGTMYLSNQWKKFSNSFILATASYNAREEAIWGWVKTRYNNNSLYFIEDIPYEETRNYIKLVMRNYLIYSFINEKKVGYFPENLLKIKGKTNEK